ncbi:GPO family capsid scaffolding protein [Comamonas sediminis]|uniref:GPO family capsid scaffolding protein n=1 Tax=Comamonas sediminis TaxID=1783360 RepID=A0ABV4B6D6_9BURK
MSRKHSAVQAPKFFRVAVEGATVDGRTIQRSWLTEAANNFDADVRGARVWVEHMRSKWSDSPFSAQGDVVALKAEEIKEGKLAGKMALFAAIKPLPELVELNKRGKKIYSSIEIEPKFADTGEAYVTGLAVTDDPASLGTEVLKFSAKRDQNKFSTEFLETTLEFSAEEEDDDRADAKAARAESQGLLSRLMKRFARNESDSGQAFKVIEAMGDTIEVLQDQVDDLEEKNTKFSKDYAKLAKRLDALEKQGTDLQEFRNKLEGEPDGATERPNASGNNNDAADC